MSAFANIALNTWSVRSLRSLKNAQERRVKRDFTKIPGSKGHSHCI